LKSPPIRSPKVISSSNNNPRQRRTNHMGKKKRVSREDVVSALSDALSPLSYVHALWEGGAPGYGRLDEWSDIDAYILVDDGKVEQTFRTVERTLGSLSGIEQKYDIGPTSWPGVFQAFYRMENASKYLILDLAVLTTKSEETFLEPEVHGGATFRFNKRGRAKPKALDKDELEAKIQKRLERLKARFEMFGMFVQKEMNRRNWIEAADLYRLVVLDSLTEVLRMKHKPVHYDFKTRYIHYELPAGDAKRLKRLYFVSDEKDLLRKYGSASRWFKSTVAELERTGIRVRRR